MEVRQRRKKRVVPDKETDDQALQQRDSKQDVEEEDPTEAEKRSPETDHGSQNDSWTLQLDGQLIALFIAACIMLFYRLDLPSDVVWDEVHFGKFASSYIKREFFFDVHPPLGKLLLAAVAALCGYQGDFSFEKIGDSYDASHVPSVLMRAVSACSGVVIVCTMYLIVRKLCICPLSALLAGMLVLEDSCTLLLSRLILLDAPLLACVMLAVLASIHSHVSPLLSARWWRSTLLCGLCLGAAVSIKHVGLAAVALVGCHALMRTVAVWRTWRRVLPTLLGYALCLVVLPLAVYTATFYAHFAILTKSGTGDAFMSREFQSTLISSRYQRAASHAPQLASGSRVMLRPQYGPHAWLHSHPFRYPVYPSGDAKGLVSSHQQQVTAHSNKNDMDNWWRVELVQRSPLLPEPNRSKPNVHPIQHGDTVRLVHVMTGHPLNSHDVAAPLSHHLQEVSCFAPGDERAPVGQVGHIAQQDLWRIDVIASTNPLVLAGKTHVRFVHLGTMAALQVSGQILPDWGFGQMEVVTNRELDQQKASVWIVDEHEHAHGDVIAAPASGNMSFVAKLVEMHRVMIQANGRLTGNHPAASSPLTWPLSLHGALFWSKEDRVLFLTGNAPVWWVASASLLALALAVVSALLPGNQKQDTPTPVFVPAQHQLTWPLLGWLLHFAPFLLLRRQLFLHHYWPAHLFAVLSLVCCLEHFLIVRLSSKRAFLVAARALIVLAAFGLTPTFVYGTPLMQEEMEFVRLQTETVRH